MREHDWMNCEDPRAMLDFQCPSSVRKLRLYGFALWDQWRLRGSEYSQKELSGHIDEDLWAIDNARTIVPSNRWNLYTLSPKDFVDRSIEAYTVAGIQRRGMMTKAGIDSNRCRLPLLQAANLLREVVGNPFRPCLPKLVQGQTAKAMAEMIYESRDFSLLPILADALEDGGYDDADVLDHLRGYRPCKEGCRVTMSSNGVNMAYEAAGPDSRWILCPRCKGSGTEKMCTVHVRGCWALDRLTGRL